MAGGDITFGGLDILGLADTTDTVSGYVDSRWICQNSSDDDQSRYAISQNCKGDELRRSSAYDGRNEISATYLWDAASGLGAAAAIADIGVVIGSYLVTGWTIDSSNDDFPTITFTAHNHDNNAHDSTDSFAVYSLDTDVADQLTGAFGAYDFLVASDTGTSDAAAASSSITFECDHEDIMNSAGNELAGENLNGRLSCSVTYNGQPDAVDTAGNWNVTSDNSSRENTGFETVAYSAERGVTQDT